MSVVGQLGAAQAAAVQASHAVQADEEEGEEAVAAAAAAELQQKSVLHSKKTMAAKRKLKKQKVRVHPSTSPCSELHCAVWGILLVLFLLAAWSEGSEFRSSAVSSLLQQRMQKRLVRKQQRLEAQQNHWGITASAAILDLIYDAHALADKLFGTSL